MTTETDAARDGSTEHNALPQMDYWGNAVEHFDDGPVGAGERRECQSCGATTMQISMVAVTADSSNSNWEEFYRCENCGATASFRFYGETDSREWTGRIAYPEE